jgi:hypothetical protein
VYCQQVKSALQLIIDEGGLVENKKISFLDCEGLMWSYDKEDNRTLKIVATDDGIDILEVPDVTIHRWDEEMIIGLSSDDKDIVLIFLERGDEYSKK